MEPGKEFRVGRKECLVSSQLASRCKFALLEIDSDHLAAAEDSEGLDGQQADHASADDHSRATGLYTRNLGGMHRNRNCFDERRLFVGEGVRQTINDVLGDGDVFGEGAVATVVAAGDAEYLAAVAEINIACGAECTLAAGYGGVEGDSVADVEGANVSADLCHNASGLMPHDERRYAAACAAIITVHIASAYSAGLDLDQHVLETNFRLGYFPDLKISNVLEHKSLHVSQDNPVRPLEGGDAWCPSRQVHDATSLMDLYSG
jgi:hypothetical protein